MKICILTVQVPFITGGAELHAEALKEELVKRRYETEIVRLPFKWYPPERLLDCMLAARLVDLEEVNGKKIDRLIALKFPAYFVPHPNKVCWIMHQHRQAYDLFGSSLSDLWQSAEGRAVAAEIKRWDDHFLRQSRAIYANSKKVAARLLKFNQIVAQPLYHPPFDHANLHCNGWDNYIFYPGRFDALKRQHLLFEALPEAPSDLHFVFCGQSDSDYGIELQKRMDASPWRSRIKVLGQISQEQKRELYANCLAVYNGVLDEDYGYVTLEAFYSGKPVVTHTDSGGPLEFVADGYNGYVTEPDAHSLAQALTALSRDVAQTKELGRQARESLAAHKLSWEHVLKQLLGS